MKWIDYLIEFLIIFLVIFSPLIYGGITNLPLSLIEGISFLLLFIFPSKSVLEGKISLVKIPAWPLFLFIFLIAFQLIPLPEYLLSVISPNTLLLYKNFRVNFLPPFTLSIYPEATISMFLQFLSFIAVFFVTLNYVDTEKKSRRLILAVIISGFLYSLYGIIRKIYVPLVGFSTFTNKNHFAAYAEMVIPLGICYSLTEFSKTRRLMYIFMVSVSGLALFLSLSRAGIICFSLSILLFLMLFKVKRPIKKGLGAVIALLLVLSLFLGVVGTGAITKRLETLQSPFKAMQGRIEVLKDAPRLIADFPLFGTGLGTFMDIFQKYKTFSIEQVYRFSHNEPIQLLVEAGFFGFLSIFLFFIFYFKRIFSLWLKRRDPHAVYITLGLIIGLFSISMHSIFDFVFHVPSNAILFFIFLAVTFRTVYFKKNQEELQIPKVEFSLTKYLHPILIGVFCFSLFAAEMLILGRYEAEALFERVKEKKITESGVDAILEYKKALKIIDKTIAGNSLNSSYFSKKADFLSELATREDLQNELSGLDGLKDKNEILLKADHNYRIAISLNSTRADNHIKLGWVHAVLGEKEAMKKEFDDALLLDPQNKKIQSYVTEHD